MRQYVAYVEFWHLGGMMTIVILTKPDQKYDFFLFLKEFYIKATQHKTLIFKVHIYV